MKAPPPRRCRPWAVLALAGALGCAAHARDHQVLVDGVGCRTRQLAVVRCWERIPAVETVEVLRRDRAPADNQRLFVVRTAGDQALTAGQLRHALGRRAERYRVLRVEPAPDQQPLAPASPRP